MKSVQIRSYFWSVFSCIRTEYRDLRSKPPYLVQTQEIKDQNIILNQLNLSWWNSLSCRKQSNDLQSKSVSWFLYGSKLRHETINYFMNFPITTNCAKLLKFVIKYGKSPLVQVNEYNICYRNISAVNELIWNDEYWQVTLCKKRLFILWISFFRSCHHRCSIKNVFWKFAKFTGKRLCHSLFLKKLKAWGVANFYRTPFLQNTSRRLLPYVNKSK